MSVAPIVKTASGILGPYVPADDGTLVTGIIASEDGGFGADVSGYDGVPVFTAGVVSDLTNTRGSGPDLEIKVGTNRWLKISTSDS